MAFFQPPDVPEEPKEWPLVSLPDWAGPAHNVLGMPVGERAVLIHRPDLVIAVTSMVAFPNGVAFQLLIQGTDPGIDETLFGPRRSRERTLSDEVLRFGVATADGTAASYSAWYAAEGADPPAAPYLRGGGGGGGAGRWEHGYWLWPLPPEGDFEFVCEWPALDVPETHVAVDPAPIRAAAARALTLWDEDQGRRQGGWTSY